MFRRNEKTVLSPGGVPDDQDRDLIEDAELTIKPPPPKEVNMDSLSYYKNHPKYKRLSDKVNFEVRS